MERKSFLRLPAVVAVAFVTAGCDYATSNPVVFGQATSLGITVGQSPTTQTPELVLGYKDANIAVLPTIATDANGNITRLGSASTQDGGAFEETFSVLGQFQANTEAKDNAPSAALGKFFATGFAAQKLSAGFACSVSDGKDVKHCHAPKEEGSPSD
ncbi:MAG: hypothetical protein AAGH68_10060 [Pseudomonadota bacterium]